MDAMLLKILVADGRPSSLSWLEDFLHQSLPDAELILAPVGHPLLTLALAHDPDTILLGFSFPHAALCELCRQLKADPRARAIPVLLLTTQATPRAVCVAALEAGVDALLGWPCGELELASQFRLFARVKLAGRGAKSLPAQGEDVEYPAPAGRGGTEYQERTNLQQLRTLLDISPDGIVVATMEGVVQHVSAQALRLYGFATAEEVIGRNIFEFLDASSVAFAQAQIAAKAAGQPIDPAEYLVIKRDGTRFHAEINAELLRDETGRPTHLFLIERDISQRKRAEAALLYREEVALRQNTLLLDLMLRGTLFHADLAVALADITEAAAQIVDVERVSVWRYSEDLSTLHCLDLFERSKGRHSAGAELPVTGFPAYNRSVRQGQAVVAVDVHVDPRTRELPPAYLNENDIHSLIDAPVWLQGAIGGIVCFEQVASPRDWSLEEMRLCTTMATLVSLSFEAVERARVETALRESELRYRSLLEQAPIGIAVHSEGRVVFTNAAMAQLLGAQSPDVLVGRSIGEIIHPASWAAARARYPRMLAGEKGLYPVEEVFVRLDGTLMDVEVIATPLPFQGQPAVQSIVMDITARKRAEAERTQLLAQVQAQAAQITQILDTVPQGVLLLDEAGRVLLANPVGMRDLAILAEVTVGEQLTRLGNLSLADLLASAPAGPWAEIQAGARTYEAIARPLVLADAGDAIGASNGHWVVVVDNVTHQRAARNQLQQQERLAAVGQLTAGIAHDFNNLLAIIALQVSMVVRSPELAGRDRERLAIIGEQTAAATALIQQLLDFSRRAVLERRPIDLGLLLGEQARLLARTLPEHIQVVFDCAPGDYPVLADPTRIQQLVVNLALNARDAMPQGGTLRLTLRRIEQPPRPEMTPGTWICLTVADSGTGIAPEILPHLFEPFYTTKPRGQGTGLGLAQVYGIVKQHTGEIEVHSAAGAGVTVEVYLPALATAAPAQQPPKTETPKGDGATLLVVEDNDILLETMRDLVEVLGYHVLTAQNGREALACLQTHPAAIDLVVTDLIMPQMGGDALVVAMREIGLTTPVVMLSGHPLDAQLESLEVLGLAGWLLKPPSLAELAQLIKQTLAGSTQPVRDHGLRT